MIPRNKVLPKNDADELSPDYITPQNKLLIVSYPTKDIPHTKHTPSNFIKAREFRPY